MQSEGFNNFGKNSGFHRVEVTNDVPQFPSWYIHNTLVLEIANNFPFARWFMYRHKENLLKKVDIVERDWLNFLIQNKINILSYEKDQKNKFIRDFYKSAESAVVSAETTNKK